MAKNIRFHRVTTLPATGTEGHVYFESSTGLVYVFTGSSFEQYGEDYHNKVTELSENCTNLQYPSAKAVYDVIVENEEITAAALCDLDERLSDVEDTYVDGTRKINGIPLSSDVTLTTLDLENNSGYITKAVSDLTNYYTKTEVDGLIDVIDQFSVSLVDSLPEASEDVTRTIYFVPNSGEGDNIKDEYICIEAGGTYAWEKIGSTDIDLTGYVTTEYVEEIEEVTATALTDLNGRLGVVENTLPEKQDELTAGSGITIENNVISASTSFELLTEITWAELKDLRDNGELVPGMQYRIIDYRCTTAQENTKSADHQFDIIVTADDEKTLNENARAISHPTECEVINTDYGFSHKRDQTIDGTCYDQDYYYGWTSFNGYVHAYTKEEHPSIGDIVRQLGTVDPPKITSISSMPIDYFANCNLAAWDLKYCLDNDANRFAWADTTNGKGVIYYMKDEFNNECPYDFKNIQFYRKWNSTKSLWCDSGTASNGVATYTFSSTGNSSTTLFTDFSLSINNNVYSNIIKEYIFSKKQTLNNNCFFGTNCYSNTFGNNCYSNTFGNNCYSNTFGSDCYNNTFYEYCYNNTFGNGCRGNAFSDTCWRNTFGNSCYNNTFRSGCYNNTFDKSCYNNTFRGCNNNTFGIGCNNNTFGNNCLSNTFGNSCYNNKFGTRCENNTFGSDCYNNTFGADLNGTAGDYFQYNIVENGVQYVILYNTTTASSNQLVKNYHIKSSVVGTSSSKKLIEATRNLAYDTTVALNSSGELKIYCEADLIA